MCLQLRDVSYRSVQYNIMAYRVICAISLCLLACANVTLSVRYVRAGVPVMSSYTSRMISTVTPYKSEGS